MTQEDRDEWVAALRSGKYTQGSVFLNCVQNSAKGPDPINEFCCLGVLCELQFHKLGMDKKIAHDKDLTYSVYGVDGSCLLPLKMQERFQARNIGFKIPIDDCDEKTKETLGSLAYKSEWEVPRALAVPLFNDAGVPFSEMANFIEKYVEIVDHY